MRLALPKASRGPSALLLLSLHLASCGGGTSAPIVRDARDAAEIIVEAPGESAEFYESAPSGDAAVIGGAEAAGVERAIRRAATASSRTTEGDGRLALLAAWSAEQMGDAGQPPPFALVELFARHLGLVEPIPHMLVVGHGDRSALETSVEARLTPMFARAAYTHYGAVITRRNDLTFGVVVLSERRLDLERVPRRLESPGSITLRGRLAGELRRPSVAVTRPDGAIERFPAGAGPDFDLAVPLNAVGAHQVELLAVGGLGDTVIANFPVYVGVPVPRSVTVPRETRSAGSANEVEAQLLRLLAAARGPSLRLELDPALSEVARSHGRDMIEHRFYGHVSATTGTPAERVRRAGLGTGLVLENIGRGYGAQEIHDGLLASPGHRANMLNPDVTHVGIGVVPETEGDRTAYVATLIFSRMTAALTDTAAAAVEVLAAINRARASRGAPPLESDEVLARAASESAARFFAEPDLTQQDVVDDASASLRRYAIAYRRVAGLMAVASVLEDASTPEPALDASASRVGIGVAQGTRPDTDANSIGVVILLGWPR